MMTSASPRFPDIQTHWARAFIEGLAERNIVRGFPDGNFRPEQGVTRAEFAVMAQAAFPQPLKRPYVPFVDVPDHYWAAGAIRWAYERGFLSGFPGQQFRPTERIPRGQVLVALVSGLELTTSETVPLDELYRDADQIPGWARSAIATATVHEIVVNSPSLQRLRPTQPATRAEVCAFVYQCLVSLQQAPAIASNAIVRWQPQPTIAVSHPREFRAAWITSVWNKDWPSRSGLSSQQQQVELTTILDQLQATNFNAVVLQVRPEGDALYRSTLDPWSHWLTGQQGKAPEPFYDPLEFAIAQAHQRNLELHVWFNPYRARTSKNTVNAFPHIAVTNPEVVYAWGNQLWMDPGSKVVQDRTYNVILDVVKRYDIDGVHLDDYFYPYPIAGQTFPDQKTYQDYRNRGGTLSLADWRRDNVNQLIQRLLKGIRAIKPHVKFGISPFGIYRPGQPPSIEGLDAYDRLYADSLKWLQQGWVDYLAPQLYWRIDAPKQSYPVLMQWWADNNPRQRHLYIGNNLAQLDGKVWELAEIERQIELTRQLKSKQVLGNIFFSMSALAENAQGVRDRFRTLTYRSPALAPVISWLSAPAPPLPTQVKFSNGQLLWSSTSPDIRAWTLYQQTGSQWALQRILSGSDRSIRLSPGTYALCAVNRLAQESLGVVVKSG
ncbi:glycoside hydrolase family 10 protein [Leptodesmis sichuanensis]|uniref:glycoside hydrolase family 10 protein n=1 Tax=Leptodesmis sichuanensis TaxID=2906798 RepID=UPI001F1DA273